MLRGLTKKVEEIKLEESKYLDHKTSKFSHQELKGFPAGVDPTKKEAYLSDAEFQTLFGMNYDAFLLLKKWKQQEVKKKHELF